MIRITAAPDSNQWSTDDYPHGTGWGQDERGNLDIFKDGGEVIATYRDGTWFRIWEEAAAPVDDRDDPPTA